jgi:hypothetical protein
MMAKAKVKEPTTAQMDELREIESKHLDSIPEKVRSGALDPSKFDVDDIDLLRPLKAESLRIEAALAPLLNKHYGRGKYEFAVSFWLEGAPETQGVGGYQVLTPESIREIWTEELKKSIGLHEYNGAVCWAGRGRFDRHILCVKTTNLRARQFDAKEKQLTDQFAELETQVDQEGVSTGPMTITEDVKRVPLHADPGAVLDDDDESGDDN